MIDRIKCANCGGDTEHDLNESGAAFGFPKFCLLCSDLPTATLLQIEERYIQKRLLTVQEQLVTS